LIFEIKSTVAQLLDIKPARVLPALILCEGLNPCFILGSFQKAPVKKINSMGISVERRKTGGSGVYYSYQDMFWFEIQLPAQYSIAESFLFAGTLVRDALRDLYIGVTIYEGPYLKGPGGEHLCFLTKGPGELFLGDRKTVGLCQRRTKDLVRVQGAVLFTWEPEFQRELLYRVSGRYFPVEYLNDEPTKPVGVDIGYKALAGALKDRFLSIIA
jgi:lipoate-protein ligase A